MTRSRRCWALCVVIRLSGTGLFAQQPQPVPPPPVQPPLQVTAPSEVFTGKAAEFQGSLFHVNGLIVWLKFDTSAFGNINGVTLRATNPSVRFLDFHLEDLVIVDGDQSQVTLNIVSSSLGPGWFEVPCVHLAPGASKNMRYVARLKPPLKIYFSDSLLAEITK
jgi:hypothetical protein